MQFLFKLPIVVASTLLVSHLCSIAQAHPGHSVEVVPADSWLHYFVQPEHLAAAVIFACASVISWLFCSRRLALAPAAEKD